MKKTKIKGIIKVEDGNHYTKEDSIDMEIHDAVDYIVLKYITKGSKIQAIPAKFVTEMSREENRISQDKTI